MERQMLTNDPGPQAAALERLSALADGELDAQSAPLAFGQWAESAQSRSAWHAYHVIGDVLRSEDLACDPAGEARFLAAFRARLADEPVVLAPRPLDRAANGYDGRATRPGGRRWGWLVPSAAAAGFVAVAGSLMLARGPAAPPAAAVDVAQVQPAAVQPAAVRLRAGPEIGAEPQTFVANGPLLRDARLDRYLAAHKQFAGSTVLGVPSVFLRNATADAADR
jgi:sigma-E factor negative regulatory protein RseA